MRNEKRNTTYVLRAAISGWLLLSVSVAGQAPPERSRTEGLQETDRFIKAGRATDAAAAAAKLEVQKTLTAYNTLVTQPSKNMKGDYKKLMKSMDSMDSKVADATTKIAAMQSAADTYFQGRGETLKNIQDPALQKQAQERLDQSKKDFASVLSSLREAGGALEPFRKQLADQITFLGSDLNPSATASLKPQAEKLNAQGTKVFNDADEAIARANDYFNGLKGQS